MAGGRLFACWLPHDLFKKIDMFLTMNFIRLNMFTLLLILVSIGVKLISSIRNRELRRRGRYIEKKRTAQAEIRAIGSFFVFK